MKLRCHPYRIPLTKPLVTSDRTYHYRTGLIFSAVVAEANFYGEAAPLPGFSTETTDNITSLSRQYLDYWQEILASQHPSDLLDKHYQKHRLPPSLQFGLDTLAYRVEAHRSHQKFLSTLFTDVHNQLLVNGLVQLSSRKKTLKEVKSLAEQGFSTIKCKVGIDKEHERQLLNAIQERYPDLRIRLDANRAWTLQEAKQWLSSLAGLNIEYCEEPLAHPTPQDYERLTRHTAVDLAIDETLTASDWQDFLPHCAVLILKPMVIGSFHTLITIKKQAEQHDCALVLTTSLESSIGRSVTALLAGGVGSTVLAHGLDTGSMLAEDVLPGWPPITSGRIRLSDLHHQNMLPVELDKIITGTIDI